MSNFLILYFNFHFIKLLYFFEVKAFLIKYL